MSGLQIFNANPRLYWGQYGANNDVAAFEITSRISPAGDAIGLVRLKSHVLRTTGVGVSRPAATERRRAAPFPAG